MLFARRVVADFLGSLHLACFEHQIILLYARFCNLWRQEVGYAFANNVIFKTARKCFKILVGHYVAGFRILKHHKAWQVIHNAAQLLLALPQGVCVGLRFFKGFLPLGRFVRQLAVPYQNNSKQAAQKKREHHPYAGNKRPVC